ncbi:F-box/LRR-repeat protein [Actinidia chinensis var. chinensis]|uniref:F-box/LRR-repeat protein n=1 Tax=Actinidia chinensis var. chinensis TaxID=1590841 RepID=A0A2R6QCH8_ACTCC|nr:F-box/LRR-repeat protein [Actinidia chinensis var. chinensis]
MFGYFATLYLAERTPKISRLVLSSQVCVNMVPIFTSLLYWRNLRAFRARMGPEMGILVILQLLDHCKSITELRLQGTMMEREASCIVEGFPKLEKLDISESTLSCNALEIVLDGRLKCVKEISILHSKIIGDDGKDIREDYAKLKGFKNKVLERASGLKSLKKLMHCLVKTCPDCEVY